MGKKYVGYAKMTKYKKPEPVFAAKNKTTENCLADILYLARGISQHEDLDGLTKFMAEEIVHFVRETWDRIPYRRICKECDLEEPPRRDYCPRCDTFYDEEDKEE